MTQPAVKPNRSDLPRPVALWVLLCGLFSFFAVGCGPKASAWQQLMSDQQSNLADFVKVLEQVQAKGSSPESDQKALDLAQRISTQKAALAEMPKPSAEEMAAYRNTEAATRYGDTVMRLTELYLKIQTEGKSSPVLEAAIAKFSRRNN